MALKIILLAALLLICSLVWSCTRPAEKIPAKIIDSTWWNALSEEWKMILLYNQNFSRQGVNIFSIQEQYLNRLNQEGEEPITAQNTALHDLIRSNSFSLGYPDFYKRAIRTNLIIDNDKIDLENLNGLDTIYMTNGPGDLSPLVYFPHLKVLIINSCGVGPGGVVSQPLDLSPLKNLQELKVLHCSSVALTDLSSIGSLTGLEELVCDQSSITTLSPVKHLKKLRKLSFGPGIEKAPEVADLTELEELYIRGCKKVPDLGKLKKLKRLSVEEEEMAIVNSGYRIKNIEFLYDLEVLEYLDIYFTSFSGSLIALESLKNLKAVTLPSGIPDNEYREMKSKIKDVNVINAYTFEVNKKE